MKDLIPLAIASAFWPILLAVVLISLRASHPGRLMASFLVGGLLTTMVVGLIVIYVLKDASLTTHSDSWFGPGVEIAAGIAALVLAYVLRARRHRAAPVAAPTDAGPSRMERMLDRGAPLAFIAGIVFNIVPGVVPLVALKDIAELDYSFGATVALLLGFYLIMFAFIEVPIVAYLFAPERTASSMNQFNAWLGRNGRRVGVYVLAGVGCYLLVRGIAALFR